MRVIFEPSSDVVKLSGISSFENLYIPSFIWENADWEMNINKKKEMTVLIGIRFNSLGSPSYFMIISFDSIKVNLFL